MNQAIDHLINNIPDELLPTWEELLGSLEKLYQHTLEDCPEVHDPAERKKAIVLAVTKVPEIKPVMILLSAIYIDYKFRQGETQ